MSKDDWVRTGVQWRFRPTGKRSRSARENLSRRQEALSGVPLFSGLSKRQLKELARVTGIADYDADETLVKEGAAGEVFFVILDGKAKVTRGGRTVARLETGDFFGEMALIDGGPRTASVVTESPSRFLSLSRRDFRALMEQDAALATRLLEEMGRRLRAQEKPPVG